LALRTPYGLSVLADTGDVPSIMKIGGKDVPLGRYLRKKLRQALDVYKVDPTTGEVSYGTPSHVLKQLEVEMRRLLTDKLGAPSFSSPWSSQRVESMIVSDSKGPSALKQSRDKIFKSRRSL